MRSKGFRKFLLSTFLCLLSLYCNGQTMVTVHTNMGVFVVEMTEDVSPITSGNFIDLANEGFYDGVIFHRIIDNFVVQGGDPTGTGAGGPGYSIVDEFGEGLSNVQGTLSMANSGPNTGGSQFFINLVDNVALDWDVAPTTSAHPVFGRVLTNFDLVEEIGSVMTNAAGLPNEEVRMDSVRVWADPENGLLTYWSMDEDLSSDLGTVAAANVDAFFAADRFGEQGSALLLANGGHVSGDDRYDEFFIRENQPVSFALWFKPVNTTSFAPLISKHSTEACAENQEQFYVAKTEDGGIEVKISGTSDGANSLTYRSEAGIIEGNEWTHLVFTYDPTLNDNDGADRAVLYINGAEVPLSATLEGELFNRCEDVNAHFTVGAFVNAAGENCGATYNGSVDEFYFFNYVLSESDITTVYVNTSTGISSRSELSSISPNPVSDGRITIALPSKEQVQISVRDINGKQMTSMRAFGQSIDVSLEGYASGIYLLQVQGKDFSDLHRVVVK